TLAGAIVLECVGYTAPTRGSQGAPPGLPIPVPPDGDFLAVVGNDRSAGLVQAVTRAAGSLPGFKAVPLVVPGKGEVFPDCRRSDHAAFWEYGYSAVMLTDTANFRNPHYHQATDTLDTLDLDFMVGVAKVVAGTVADVARSSHAVRPGDV
ncbi:MAG: M28 family peptidase, partial [Nitrospirales bacterium]